MDRVKAFLQSSFRMAVPVVPAKAGTQHFLDSGFRRNDVDTQSDITFENRYEIGVNV